MSDLLALLRGDRLWQHELRILRRCGLRQYVRGYRLHRHLNTSRKQRAVVTAVRQAENTLVEALRKYGQHLPQCGRQRPPFVDVPPCDCGFAAALTSLRESSEAHVEMVANSWHGLVTRMVAAWDDASASDEEGLLMAVDPKAMRALWEEVEAVMDEARDVLHSRAVVSRDEFTPDELRLISGFAKVAARSGIDGADEIEEKADRLAAVPAAQPANEEGT